MPQPKQRPKSESPESEESSPFEKFASLAKRLVTVSKDEIKQKERKPKTAQ
jgi:hypothetical protein